MKKEKAAVEGTEIVPGIDPAIAIGKMTGIAIEIGNGTEIGTEIGTGIGTEIGTVIGEGDPVLDHVTVMDIADATSIALDHVTADVHAQEIRVNVRQDGAVQEAEKIAVQRASDRQINLHRISAQTMSPMAMEQKPK